MIGKFKGQAIVSQNILLIFIAIVIATSLIFVIYSYINSSPGIPFSVYNIKITNINVSHVSMEIDTSQPLSNPKTLEIYINNLNSSIPLSNFSFTYQPITTSQYTGFVYTYKGNINTTEYDLLTGIKNNFYLTSTVDTTGKKVFSGTINQPIQTPSNAIYYSYITFIIDPPGNSQQYLSDYQLYLNNKPIPEGVQQVLPNGVYTLTLSKVNASSMYYFINWQSNINSTGILMTSPSLTTTTLNLDNVTGDVIAELSTGSAIQFTSNMNSAINSGSNSACGLASDQFCISGSQEILPYDLNELPNINYEFEYPLSINGNYLSTISSTCSSSSSLNIQTIENLPNGCIINATYTQSKESLVVETANSLQGSVSVTFLNGTVLSGDYISANVPYGQTVSINGASTGSYTFNSWSGTYSSNQNPFSFEITQATTETSSFTYVEPSILFSDNIGTDYTGAVLTLNGNIIYQNQMPYLYSFSSSNTIPWTWVSNAIGTSYVYTFSSQFLSCPGTSTTSASDAYGDTCQSSDVKASYTSNSVNSCGTATCNSIGSNYTITLEKVTAGGLTLSSSGNDININYIKYPSGLSTFSSYDFSNLPESLSSVYYDGFILNAPENVVISGDAYTFNSYQILANMYESPTITSIVYSNHSAFDPSSIFDTSSLLSIDVYAEYTSITSHYITINVNPSSEYSNIFIENWNNVKSDFANYECISAAGYLTSSTCKIEFAGTAPSSVPLQLGTIPASGSITSPPIYSISNTTSYSYDSYSTGEQVFTASASSSQNPVYSVTMYVPETVNSNVAAFSGATNYAVSIYTSLVNFGQAVDQNIFSSGYQGSANNGESSGYSFDYSDVLYGVYGYSGYYVNENYESSIYYGSWYISSEPSLYKPIEYLVGGAGISTTLTSDYSTYATIGSNLGITSSGIQSWFGNPNGELFNFQPSSTAPDVSTGSYYSFPGSPTYSNININNPTNIGFTPSVSSTITLSYDVIQPVLYVIGDLADVANDYSCSGSNYLSDYYGVNNYPFEWDTYAGSYGNLEFGNSWSTVGQFLSLLNQFTNTGSSSYPQIGNICGSPYEHLYDHSTNSGGLYYAYPSMVLTYATGIQYDWMSGSTSQLNAPSNNYESATYKQLLFPNFGQQSYTDSAYQLYTNSGNLYIYYQTSSLETTEITTPFIAEQANIYTTDFINPAADTTFTESGLPSGTSWSITYDGYTQSSSSSSIIFPSNDYTPNLGQGLAYTYNAISVITPGTEYYPSLYSGSVDAGSSQTINYSPGTGTIFTENGLPSGTTWYVTYDGVTGSSSTSSIEIYAGTSGTSYSYSIPNEPDQGNINYITTEGYTPQGSGCNAYLTEYTGSSNSGSTTDVQFTGLVAHWVVQGLDSTYYLNATINGAGADCGGDYTFHWGDGTSSIGYDAQTHEYSSAGTYEITGTYNFGGVELPFTPFNVTVGDYNSNLLLIPNSNLITFKYGNLTYFGYSSSNATFGYNYTYAPQNGVSYIISFYNPWNSNTKTNYNGVPYAFAILARSTGSAPCPVGTYSSLPSAENSYENGWNLLGKQEIDGLQSYGFMVSLFSINNYDEGDPTCMMVFMTPSSYSLDSPVLPG